MSPASSKIRRKSSEVANLRVQIMLGYQSRLVIVCLLVVGAAITPARAQNLCSDEAGRADAAIREQYQQAIDYWLKLAAAAQLKGYDPRHFPQVDQFGNVQDLDLVEIAHTVSLKRDEAIQAIFVAYQQCNANIAPYQAIINTTVFFMTGGLSQAVPERARHIDAGQLLNGTPLGGPGALVPQTREYIFARLGIGGDVAAVIRNPLQVTQGGTVRLPWNPILGSMGGSITLPPFPMPGSINLPPLPPLPNPPSVQIGSVGGHRVCLPWC
jgi:hypothetical protein